MHCKIIWQMFTDNVKFLCVPQCTKHSKSACVILFHSSIKESVIHGEITCDYRSDWKGCGDGGNYHTNKRSWIYEMHCWNCDTLL